MQSLQIPGVYTAENAAFSNVLTAVPTAVPAFIGYTAQAVYNGKSYLQVPFKISSFEEFCAVYCLANSPSPQHVSKQYAPQYYLVEEAVKPVKGDYMIIHSCYYSVQPDPASIYYLYNSVRLFYQNGGGDAYIVSVGNYGQLSGKPVQAGNQAINPNVQLRSLLDGVSGLAQEQEPTLYLCPDATLLTPADNATLMEAMLAQCGQLQTAVSIFDIIGADQPDPVTYMDDISNFRNNTGNNCLNYGAAYYPFIGTRIMQPAELDYTNFFGGDVAKLAAILNPPENADPALTSIFNDIQQTQPGTNTAQNNNALLAASDVYTYLMTMILNRSNILPPSGAIAGIITQVDNIRGVWTAPANVKVNGAATLPIRLSDEQQVSLNTDIMTGKSVNAIRFFNGLGILVWGARTLDGNSQDWRYLNVRRTVIFIEQTCKLAAKAYVFEPNTSQTWTAINSMISNFLTNCWKGGGLAGSTPEDAFAVECGLGSTMTPNDILDGVLKISVKVAITRPAEFIVISFQQQQQRS